ncbi:MAG: RagB/SusD family nutrient uptake outer membrane protein [Balneolaceae bacterium]|nr:RagB/SusD family nutrient uptake outer membrane protein [Balneolaceae bacterium]
MYNFKTFVLIIFAALVTVSCTDLLNEDIRSQVGDERFNSPSGFNEIVNASYTNLRHYYGTERGHGMTEGYGVDIFHEGADGSHKQWNFYGVQLNASTGWVTELWDFMYEGINMTNTVINRGQSVEGLDPDVVRVRSAEAHFLRAHYYFILVQQYGAVHITTEETQGVEIEASRAPVSEVFNQIVSDLEHAIDNLPIEASDYGRATRPAAEHLLARVLLTRASEFYRDDAGEPGDYDRAAELALRVINDYNFSLLDDVSQVWAIGNEEHEEVIWSLQYSDNPLLNEGGNNSHLYYLTTYDEMPAMNRTVEYGRPWKRFRPTEFLYDDLLGPETREHDSRYDAFFRDVFYASVPGTYTINGVDGVEVALGDTAIYFPGVNWSLEEIQTKPYTVVIPNCSEEDRAQGCAEYNPRDFPTLAKHEDPNRPEMNTTQGIRNFLAFRLAETHLIAAEALLLGSGSLDAATEHLNVIRRRAAWPGQEGEMELDPSEVDLIAIIDERARELLGEQFRWYDLKRTGMLIDRAYQYNPEVANVGLLEEKHLLRPIPQTQIDRTAGGSSAFPQNPGY